MLLLLQTVLEQIYLFFFLSLLLFFLPILFPSSCLQPLSIICSSPQVVFIVAPDASASLLRWSLAHACFHLGSLCSSFAFPLVLLLSPPPCRQSCLSEMGRLLGLCINHSSPVLPAFLFPFLPLLCLLPVCVCFLSFTSSDPSASTPDSSFPCLLTACVNMSVVSTVSSSIRSGDIFCFNALIVLSWSTGTVDPASLFVLSIKRSSLFCSKPCP